MTFRRGRICKDVKGLGRWENGDVEAGLSSLDDLPYIIGLVRQAYEKQMVSGRNSKPTGCHHAPPKI